MRRLFKIFITIFVITGALIIFYFKFPKIWGEVVYPLEYEDLIKKYTDQYSLPPSLVCAVIFTESRFHKDSVSHQGATGLMQIMPQTGSRLAKTFGDTDFSAKKLFDPETNIRYGTYYLREKIDDYGGDIDLALAGYNGGDTAASALQRRQPIPLETAGFIRKVRSVWQMYEKIYGEKLEKKREEEEEAKKQEQLRQKIEEQINEKEEILVEGGEEKGFFDKTWTKIKFWVYTFK